MLWLGAEKCTSFLKLSPSASATLLTLLPPQRVSVHFKPEEALLRFRTDVGSLKPTVRTLARWSQGNAFQYFNNAELRAEGDLLHLTLTTPLGTAHLTVDAEVEVEGCVGVDIPTFSKFLAPIRGKDWELLLSLEPCPKVEGRQLFVANFREGGCKRSRFEWPYTGRRGELFTNTSEVPDPMEPKGVIREFRAPRPRLSQLLQAGLAAHSQVEQGISELHSAGLTVAADMAAAFSLNAKYGVRSQLFADGDLGFVTGWAGEEETISLDAQSLERALQIIEAFGGVAPWSIQVPERGPVRFCPSSSPTDAWVTVPQTIDVVNLPELLDEIRASKDENDGITKVEASIRLNQSNSGKLRSVITELEILSAYASADPLANKLTLAFEADALVIEAISDLHLGGGVRIPWESAPHRELVRCVSSKCLVASIKAITLTSEPDATVDICFWASDHLDLERFYLSTSSEKGESADALLMPMDSSDNSRRLADVITANQTASTAS
jgi:hypothetical protein